MNNKLDAKTLSDAYKYLLSLKPHIMYLRLCPKYTLGFLSRVLKICLLYCFHGLFVALAVKQMYLLLSVQLCKTIFPSRWHHTALWSSAHCLLLPLPSQQNGAEWFSRSFLFHWCSQIPPRNFSTSQWVYLMSEERVRGWTISRGKEAG